MKFRGQGAIEYLLLLAAAVVVVAVVISFMISTIKPTTDAGDTQTYDYLCKTINTNSLACGCYQCLKAKGGYTEELTPAGTYMASRAICNTLSTNSGTPLLSGEKCPVSFT